MKQVLLERRRDRRLPGCGETSEPNGISLLASELLTLSAAEGRMPCDVAVEMSIQSASCALILVGSKEGNGLIWRGNKHT